MPRGPGAPGHEFKPVFLDQAFKDWRSSHHSPRSAHTCIPAEGVTFNALSLKENF
jgi:hypothetical protein